MSLKLVDVTFLTCFVFLLQNLYHQERVDVSTGLVKFKLSTCEVRCYSFERLRVLTLDLPIFLERSIKDSCISFTTTSFCSLLGRPNENSNRSDRDYITKQQIFVNSATIC